MEGNFYNNVLSRCDTIHDFTKARATKNMKKGFTVDNVYGYLDGVPALKRKELVRTFKDNYTNGNPNILADFEQILTNNTPNFYFMKSYDNGFDDRRAGFEPAVVQFFEHVLGQKKDVPLEPLYLTSNKELMQNAFIDYTKPSPKDVHSVPGRVCILNLGNTGKDDEPVEDDEEQSSSSGREASGIFDNAEAYEQFQSDLVTFFASASAPRIRFVIDASIVGNQHFHEPNTGLEVAILACSQWDSASKFSDGVLVPESRFETRRGDPDGVLYALNSLAMRAEAQFTSINYSCEMNERPIDKWDELPRQVGNIILSAQDVGKQGTNYKRILLQSGDPVFKDRYGVLFDIKRSGDGCQVLEIKRLNQVSHFKYVLVTNDHLAFLKARMNNVPAVFTKKNTTTDTKTLVCVNNEVKNPEMYVMIIARHLVAEAQKMRELAGSVGEVQEGINQVILAFTAAKSALAGAYFGEQMSDAYFRDRVVLKALFHPKAAPEPFDLSPVQQSDLEYIAARIKVYILDFLSCLIDLKTRLVIVEQLFRRYVAIADEIDRMQIAGVLAEITDTYSDPMQAASAFYARVQQDGVEDMLQSLMKTLSLMRSKAYGTDLYDWALDTNNIVAPFVDKLNELAAYASGKSPAELVDLAVNKHFFMQDKSIPQMHEILNFKPLEAYTKIWRFLKKSYQTISMSAIRRRPTRGSVQPAAESLSGESDLVKSTDKYLRTAHKMLMQTDPSLDDDVKATIERNVEAVKTFDDFYKLLIMEENVQNFSCRFYNAGLYDWQQIVGNAVVRPRNNVAPMEGGGRVSQHGNNPYRLGVAPYGMKVVGEGRYDQNKAALLMEQPGMIFERLYPADRTNADVRAKRKEQWHAFMRYAQPDDFSVEEEVRELWSEWLTFNLEPGKYASEHEIVDNWSIFKHYKDFTAVEEALYEDAVEDYYEVVNAFPAGASLGTISGHLQFEQEFDQGVLGLTVYENGDGSPVVRWTSNIAERFFTEYLDDMLFEGWGIAPDFVGMQLQPQEGMNVDFLNRQAMAGGGGSKGAVMQRAMIAYANDNVDAIIQAVVVLVGFLALNFVLHKEQEPKTIKALSFSVLCNTVFLLALLLIVKDQNVHTLAFCVYVLALGLAVMVYLSR